MIHESALFNFQETISNLREKVANTEPENEEIRFQHLLDTITEKTELEDLAFYKDYLSKFDVEHGFEGFELNYDPTMEEFKADFPLLIRFIAASFSSTYDLKYDALTDKVILIIHVEMPNKSISKQLDELWMYQIYKMFQNYFEEQLNLATIYEEDEDERKEIDAGRSERLELFQKNISELRAQKEKN